MLRRGGIFVASTPSRYNDPEIARALPSWGDPFSFDAESAPDLVGTAFEVHEIERWDERSMTLPDEAAVKLFPAGPRVVREPGRTARGRLRHSAGDLQTRCSDLGHPPMTKTGDVFGNSSNHAASDQWATDTLSTQTPDMGGLSASGSGLGSSLTTRTNPQWARFPLCSWNGRCNDYYRPTSQRGAECLPNIATPECHIAGVPSGNFHGAGVPVFRCSPSSWLLQRGRFPISAQWHLRRLRRALHNGLFPSARMYPIASISSLPSPASVCHSALVSVTRAQVSHLMH